MGGTARIRRSLPCDEVGLAALYDRLWREADEYAMNNFKGEELDYYYRVTD